MPATRSQDRGKGTHGQGDQDGRATGGKAGVDRAGGIGRFWRGQITQFAAAFAGYLLLGLVCIWVSAPPGKLSGIWLPIGFVAILLARRCFKLWPAILLAVSAASLALDIVLNGPFGASALFAVSNTAGAVVGGGLLKAFSTRRGETATFFSHIIRSLPGALAAPAAGSSCAVVFSYAANGGAIPLAKFYSVWGHWYLGDLIGFATMLPLAFAYAHAGKLDQAFPRGRRVTILTVGCVMALTTLLALQHLPTPFVVVTLVLLVSIVAVPLLPAMIFLVLDTILVAWLFTHTAMAIPIAAAAGENMVYLATALTLLPPLVGTILIERARDEHERLRRSEQRLRTIFDHSPIAGLILASDGQIVEANAKACELFGYGEAEIRSLPPLSLTLACDHDVVRDDLKNLLGKSVNHLRRGQRFVRKDRTIGWGDASATLLPSAGAGPDHVLVQVVDVTEHKRISDERETLFRRLDLATRVGGISVWEWDAATGVLLRDARMLDVLGRAMSDKPEPGGDWLDIVHPEDQAMASAYVEKAKREPGETTCEYRIVRPDGEVRYLRNACRTIAGPDGKPAKCIGVTWDTTSDHRAAEERDQLLRRLDIATAAADLGIWDWDLVTREQIWDERLYRHFAESPTCGKSPIEIARQRIHNEDFAAVIKAFDDMKDGNDTLQLEYRIVTGTGEIRYLRDVAAVIRNGDGHPVRLVGVTWDVTDSNRLAEALRTESHRLQVTLTSIADGVITTDRIGRITFLNPAAAALTGWSQVQAAGRQISDVFAPVSRLSGASIPDLIGRCLLARAVVEMQDDATLEAHDGTLREIAATAAPLAADDQVLGAVLVFQDVTSERTMRRELAFAASHDPLTGLLNRTEFEARLTAAIAAARQAGATHSLLFIDLDRFKLVNDTAGHAVGDMLLREIGPLLTSAVRSGDHVARIGGDEFAVILMNADLVEARQIAERIITAIDALRFSWHGRHHRVGASVGYGAVGPFSESAAALLTQVDVACYAAKNSGRNRAVLYEPDQGDAVARFREIQLAANLREAVQNDRFVLYAQPIRPCNGGGEEACEILLRMLDPDGNLILPDLFIPAAERFDLMHDIDRWVMREALERRGAELAAWDDMSFHLNFSGNSLGAPGFADYLLGLVARTPIPAHRLTFEITETAVIAHVGVAARLMTMLRAAGAKVALDDFGIGLSSFNYLRTFPADLVKIDGSFVRNVRQNAVDAAIVRSLNQIAHELGAKTVAEFVEDEETLACVRQIGIDFAQGYAIGRPESLDALLSALPDNGSWPSLSDEQPSDAA
ncbi:EAL domain-containing protein [Segnochrobactrum spirostomi]|uniref:EAL domain-containing protein n=1 Tax=Segnochrobactrum spirostomi TaxID=2608987 RepID=A0A6A7Y3E6_9HYPH|nr:EAL domain-containing protein [Segnochrobactrum spirostomi]MQT13235.1 EAL domain-containing protein [Segnochrobactrum spirostomi]